MKRKLIWVRWRDSNYIFGQRSIKAAKEHKVAIFETVGHLVMEDSDRLVLAGDWLPMDGEVRSVIAIPKENVVKKKVIKMESGGN
jgi:hypothetical protein